MARGGPRLRFAIRLAEATLRSRFEDSFYKPLDRSGFKGPVPTATRAWFYAREPENTTDKNYLGSRSSRDIDIHKYCLRGFRNPAI